MTPLAIVTMVVSVGVFWGGLVYTIVRLRKHPESRDES